MGSITAVKGYVPFGSPTLAYLSVDTSSGSAYSDYTFIYNGTRHFNFRRVDMNKNFRFYLKIYYDYETSPFTAIFSKKYSNGYSSRTISATINLDNGISKSVSSVISLKSGFFNLNLS